MTSSLYTANLLTGSELLDIIQETLYMRHLLNDDVVLRIIRNSIEGTKHEKTEQDTLTLLMDAMSMFDKLSQLKQLDILPQDVFMRAKMQLIGITRTCAGLLESGYIGTGEVKTLLHNYATLGGEIDFYNELYNENVKKIAAETKAKAASSY